MASQGDSGLTRRDLLAGISGVTAVAVTSGGWTAVAAQHGEGPERVQAADVPAYVAYYWRARPGRVDDYNAYIRGTAERIDEEARKAGVFIEVTTVLATTASDGAAPDWTHLRIFKLQSAAAVEGLSPGLEAATLRVVPDEAQRKANSARAAEMRDFVRREVWTALR